MPRPHIVHRVEMLVGSDNLTEDEVRLLLPILVKAFGLKVQLLRVELVEETS